MLQPVENTDNDSETFNAGGFKNICVYNSRNSRSTYIVLDLYNGESGAFRCLATGKGEVAFIELQTLKGNTGNSKGNFYLLLF
jgi:hypothetical protein